MIHWWRPWQYRICLGCGEQARFWFRSWIPPKEQYCSPKCEKALRNGYKLGLRVLGTMKDMSNRGKAKS